MKRSLVSIVLLALSVIAMPDRAIPQAADSPRSTRQSSQKHVGFLDYALAHINPEQRDYGSEIREVRAEVIRSTIRDTYFWFAVASFVLLTGVTALHLSRIRSEEKKDILAATLITELWNGTVSDRIEIDRRTEQYNILVSEKNAELEKSLAQNREVPDGEESGDSRTHKKIDRLVGGPRTGARAQAVTRTSQAEASLGTPAAADLAQHNMLLERRIEAMRNTEHNLRERLNQTTSQLDEERKRNRTLKGA